jgi:hypothetical protein
MKRFIVCDVMGVCVLSVEAASIDDVEKHPKFIAVMKHETGRLFDILEVKQAKRYERPL